MTLDTRPPDVLDTAINEGRGGTCRVCGCTDERACEPTGCWWVTPDICSVCWDGQEVAS